MHSTSSLSHLTGSVSPYESSEEGASGMSAASQTTDRISRRDLTSIPRVEEAGAAALGKLDSIDPEGPSGTTRFSNPVYGKQQRIDRLISQAAASSSVAASSVEAASPAAPQETLWQNPLYGSGSLKLKEYKNEGSGLLKFPHVLAETEYNKIAEKWVYNQIAGRAVPSKSFLFYSVLRTLSFLLARKPRLKSLKCSHLRAQVFMSGAVTNCLIEAARFARLKIAEFVESNKRSSRCLSEAMELLTNIDRWTFIEDFSDKNPSVDKLIDLYGFCVPLDFHDRGGREMLIRILFESPQNYGEVLEWLRLFFGDSKNLKPLIEFHLAREVLIDDMALDLQRTFPLEPLSAIIPKISTSSVLRAFFLGDAPNIDKVFVNGSPFLYQDPRSALAERRVSYFLQLLQRCYSEIEREDPLDDFVGQEVSSLLKGEDRGGPVQQLLSGATVESWSIADRMIRFLFPGLNAAPFIFKMPQSTEVDIRVHSIGRFSVGQRKTYEICLRKRPCDRLSVHKLPDPVCSVVFEWKVHSAREQEEWKERGELAIKELNFSPKITPYEKREIVSSLMKPYPIPAEWRTLPYPSLEREFTDPQ